MIGKCLLLSSKISSVSDYRSNYKNVDFKRMIDIYRLKSNLNLDEELFLKFRLSLVEKVISSDNEMNTIDDVYNLIRYVDSTLDILKYDAKESTYNK